MGVIENRIGILELERSGGGGGTAASVSYDNTTSHMTATDVQAALDELNLDIVEGLALVNTSVAANREAILGIEEDLYGNYILENPNETFASVTYDGVKTVAEVLEALNSAFVAYCQALPDNKVIVPTRIIAPAYCDLENQGPQKNTLTAYGINAYRVSWGSGGNMIIDAMVGRTGYYHYIQATIAPAGTVTLSSKDNDVPTSGTARILGYLYRKD